MSIALANDGGHTWSYVRDLEPADGSGEPLGDNETPTAADELDYASRIAGNTDKLTNKAIMFIVRLVYLVSRANMTIVFYFAGDGEYSYPSLLEDMEIDGLIHASYTFRRETICYQSFSIAWLTEHLDGPKTVGIYHPM